MSHKKTIVGVVKHATEVRFTAACESTDYGVIPIPAGTEVEQHIHISKNQVAGEPIISKSGWFITYPEDVCPAHFKINGEPGHMFMHDATHYGIRVPDAVVEKV